MALFRWEDTGLKSVEAHALEDKDVKERKLQDALMANPDPLEEGLFIIATEFGDWEDSRRRIDLLALDDRARLVVVELKRSQTGDHAELQAIRYAAMVSNMTRERIIRAHSEHLKKSLQLRGTGGDGNESEGANVVDYSGCAEKKLTEHLEKVRGREDKLALELETTLELWDTIETERPRIILASAGFSQEVTTSVLWLVEKYELDITCVELQLYETDQVKFLTDNRIIPLAGEEYRMRAKEHKVERERIEKKRRDPFTFEMVGIKVGATLVLRDTEIECTVADGKTGVNYKKQPAAAYEGSAWRNCRIELDARKNVPADRYALTTLANKLGFLGGTTSWRYKGKTLLALRDELERESTRSAE